MKTQLVLLLAVLSSSCAMQTEGQNRTIVNATNSEISDNLDLRVVASIFGDSNNLQDFERRLNDPKLQISNLDLNNDNQVDYLRVIEFVENRTHLVIIQSVLDRVVYQDVATIEVEKDRYNQVSIQVVGNAYMYGQNYIYEPVYYSAPIIYNSFWISNYSPYCSAWSWNYYPSYFYAWNPFPIFRYRNNVDFCLNTYYRNNNYNYVNYRRSSYAANIYNSRRSNGYERQYPNYSFERRNSNVANRYELDQIRNTRNGSSRNEVGYSQNRNESSRVSPQQRNESQRGYSQNSNETPRVSSQQRTEPQRGYSQNRNESPRVSTQQKTEPQRGYSQNNNESPRVSTQQRTEPQRANSQNRSESPRASSQQRTEPQREYSQNRSDSPRASSQQKTETQREYSQSRNETPRASSQQRTEPQRDNSSSRNSNSANNISNNNSSRNANRRT